MPLLTEFGLHVLNSHDELGILYCKRLSERGLHGFDVISPFVDTTFIKNNSHGIRTDLNSKSTLYTGG